MKKLFTKSKKIIFPILIVFIFSACEDYLDIAPEKDLTKQDFWKTSADANSALAATYSSLRNTYHQSFTFGEVRADLLLSFPGGYYDVSISNIDSKNSVVDWSNYYSTINLANTLMFFDKDVMANDESFTLKMKNGMDAEALFIRSLCYFDLVRNWKNVPLVLNASVSDTCDVYPPITEESGVIKQIITDLLRAKDIAYTTEFIGDARYFKGRANKYAIMSLLADVYLWDQQYQKCIDYCDSVISSGFYSLLSTNDWFTMYNPGNSAESIFELQCMDDGTTSQIHPFFKGVAPTNSQYFTITGGKTAKTVFSTSTLFKNFFPDNSDLRMCEGMSPAWKYVGLTLDPKNQITRSPVNQRDLNIIYYRYADILLMKAEALTELNKFDEAREYVTQTAERARLLPIVGSSDKDEMREIIRNERAKEFIIEGKRWYDLLRAAKRNGFQHKEIVTNVLLFKASYTTIDLLQSKVNDTMMYYLPVPYNELRRNKNLVQNPFYER